MAYLYSIRMKNGREIILENDTKFTKTQITNFVNNFKEKTKTEAAKTQVTKAMAYDKLIDDLIARGFRRVTYTAIIQLSGDNMDFLTELGKL